MKHTKKTPLNQSTDPLIAWRKVETRMKKMTSKERVQTLIDAGILDKKLRLTAPYRELIPASEGR